MVISRRVWWHVWFDMWQSINKGLGTTSVIILWWYFLEDSLFGLFLYNTIQRHSSNSEGNFFLATNQFIGRNPPTVQELQRQLQLKDTRYINMLRYFAQTIKGRNNYWHSCTNDLKQLINHHVSRGHGPPTFFITLSCAKNWWPDLQCILYQLEK